MAVFPLQQEATNTENTSTINQQSQQQLERGHTPARSFMRRRFYIRPNSKPRNTSSKRDIHFRSNKMPPTLQNASTINPKSQK
jgi:hypothetical protein